MSSSRQKELREASDELALVKEELSKLNSRKRQLEEKISSLKLALSIDGDVGSVKAKYDRDDFAWSTEVRVKLKAVFNIKDFRSLQKSAINATLSKEDCLLIMPTGGGKSLCFQLPALITKGLTLVVSPLISLMEDQVMGLTQLGIATRIFSSQTTGEEANLLLKEIIDPTSDLRLLYVTPEKLAKSKRLMSQLEKAYAKRHFTRLVIDEVHCCSQWGHDFRKDFKFLGIMKTQFPETPILGLTATATSKVIADVQKILNIEGCLVLKDSFYRANLVYEIRDSSSKDNFDEVADLITNRFSNQSGIIYCLTIKDTEEVTGKLKGKGIKARCYHAQLPNETRSDVHKKWYSGQVQVIVATIAFGMGINKMDVRFVIHYSLSKSLENYYQETGRAGRDGATAYCIAFYRFSDFSRATSLFFTEREALVNVYNMVSYCIDRSSCRKGVLAEYFGDKKPLCKRMCDNCRKRDRLVLTKVDVKPLVEDLVQILNKARTIKERMTGLKLMDAWFKKGSAKLRVDGVNKPTLPRYCCQLILARLIIDGYLKEDFHFTPYSTISYLVVGYKASLISKSNSVIYEVPEEDSSSSSDRYADDESPVEIDEPPVKKARVFRLSDSPSSSKVDEITLD